MEPSSFEILSHLHSKLHQIVETQQKYTIYQREGAAMISRGAWQKSARWLVFCGFSSAEFVLSLLVQDFYHIAPDEVAWEQNIPSESQYSYFSEVDGSNN
ncbi:hypothetical protein O6H91_12G106500 [Diphasiastrum complanatum]|uniref:Uncharacterized protein n=1 Tax=Diphasiastrum complanatum TaxID=34168 RepID=A0ACC2C5H7_DIPCM|nr:hypothetical protein O6H91_12G106500 [Diphasiastrum complanatum]